MSEEIKHLKTERAEVVKLEAEISAQNDLIAKLKANFLAVQNEFINEKREREQAAATFRTEIAELRAEITRLKKENDQMAIRYADEVSGLEPELYQESASELSALARESIDRELQLAKLEAEVKQMKRRFEKENNEL